MEQYSTIKLPTKEQIQNACNEYLNSIGMVDNKHIVAQDWKAGVKWFYDYVLDNNEGIDKRLQQ